MKNYQNLISLLYILARFAFRMLIIWFVSQIFFEVFTPDGKIGNFESSSHHSKGYAVQAQIGLSFSDTVIHYKNKFKSGTISKSDNFEEDDEFNKINANTSFQKTYQINNYDIWGYKYKRNSNKIATIEPQSFGSEISVIINPKEVFFKLILMLKTYLNLVFLIFVSYQFMQLFKKLKNKFNFDPIITTIIRRIGFSILILQVLKIVFSLITIYHITNIYYCHYIKSIQNSEFRFMNLNTILDFDLLVIFIGLSLLLLAKLLDYGYDIQQENDLTV